jgi:hypothetical protein
MPQLLRKGTTDMSTQSVSSPALSETPATATRTRVGLLAIVLGVTAVAAVPLGILWPEPASGGDVYLYSDMVGQRDLWWGVLVALSAMLVVNVPLQALATMILVQRRGSRWATVGAAMMWLGAGLQAVGAAGWATAYFFPTDQSVGEAAGTMVVNAVNDDIVRIFALLLPGAGLVLLGTVCQAVGLFRAHVVPVWVPVLSLFVVLTFFLPGNGLMGIITSAPMAVAAIGIGYYAWRRVA